MTAPGLPIADQTLTDDQYRLLTAIYRHVTRKDQGPVLTWATWQYVAGPLTAEGIDVHAAWTTMPTLPRHRFDYSLIWRSEPGRSVTIQPDETVGLNLAGLARVDQVTSPP